MRAQPGFAVSRDGAEVVALDLTLDDDLRRRGLAREVIRNMQDMRKAAGLEVSDWIHLHLVGLDDLGALFDADRPRGPGPVGRAPDPDRGAAGDRPSSSTTVRRCARPPPGWSRREPDGAGGEQYVLAVDLGTGGPKVAVVSTTGRIVAHASEPVTLYLLDGGGAEQDPEEWWSAICTAVAPGAGRRRRSSRRPDRRGLHVPVVGHGGRGRRRHAVDAGDDLDGLEGQQGHPQGGGRLGQRPRLRPPQDPPLGPGDRGAPGLSGKDPVSHILFIREAFPDVYRATATFLEPVDYLNLRLTGRTCASFDSIAAHWVTDNRDIDRVSYDDRLLEMTGLDRAKLPDLVPPGTIVGALTARPPPSSACPPVCRWRPARATCTRRSSARGRWPTSPPTSISAPRRGSPPTCRSRRRRPPPTWPPYPPRWPASI